MSQTPVNMQFWDQIHHYLNQSQNDHRILIDLTLAASCSETRRALPPWVRDTLPLATEHQSRWDKVKTFLSHPDVAMWPARHTVQQLRLVASGVRDGQLHDNCIALPLYS
jgi:hypothetical protein